MGADFSTPHPRRVEFISYSSPRPLVEESAPRPENRESIPLLAFHSTERRIILTGRTKFARNGVVVSGISRTSAPNGDHDGNQRIPTHS